MKLHPHPSPAQDSRIRHLVLHYTAAGLASSLQILAGPNAPVSAHYLLSDTPEADGSIPIYELVKPEQRAWHAGISSWQGINNLNFSSIGIEIVNLGFIEKQALEKHKITIAQQPLLAQTLPYQDHQGKRWFHFPKEQIAALIELAAPLVKQHKIDPTRVIGHADSAPGRKQDPGPLFPWYTLAHEEIGAWPRTAVVEYYEKRVKEKPLTIKQQQAALKKYGYELDTDGVLGPKTKNTIETFQMHFSPTDYLGTMDGSSQTVLCALIEDYFPQARPTILGTQLPSSGVSGPAINTQQFLESIASYPEDEAAQPSAATASKDQLFKPAGLCQLFNLT